MRLTQGAEAPLFQTQDVFGRPIDLAAFCDGRVLLSFFRNAACALCNLRIYQLIQKSPEYALQGLAILAVFESPPESVLRNVDRQGVPFALIADPEARLYELYGVESSPEKVAAAVKESNQPWMRGLIEQAKSIGYELVQEAGSNFYRLPADFLIEAGRVQEVYYSDRPGNHLSFDTIERLLRSDSKVATHRAD